ncbi:MAG: hypothetical protein ACK5YO_09130, partial [Planctomyces sp.]
VFFPTGEKLLSFGGSATISVAGIFEISGTVQATKTESGVIFVDIPEISAALNVKGFEVFKIGGKARFGIGGEDGFQLLDVGITTVRVMGIDATSIMGALPALALPPKITVPPPAELSTIVDGIDAALLNRRKYLDVTLRVPGAEALDIATVLDTAAEFNLSGSGVADAVLTRVEHLEGNVFRYFLEDRDAGNGVPMFIPGPVNVAFRADGWRDTAGTPNTSTTDSFTIRDGKTKATSGVSIGPLVFQGPYFALEDFSFRPLKNADGSLKGARITITVGMGVQHASLDFGGSSDVLETSVTDLAGLFDVNVDINPALQIIGGGLGKFRIDVGSMKLDVLDVLKAEASGVTVQFNPEKDTDGDGTVSSSELAAYNSQEILRLESASVTLSKLNLKGDLAPYTTRDNRQIPGLVVRKNGFHLGQAQLTYTGQLNFGSILTLKDIRAGIADFGVNFSTGVEFNGEVFIASGGADLFPGQTFSMSFKDGTADADKEAVRAGLTFRNGIPAGFKFNSDQMSMKFGEFVTVTGSQILINTEAKGSEYIVSIGSVGAEIKAGPLKIGGKMKKFGITGDGNFVTQ